MSEVLKNSENLKCPFCGGLASLCEETEALRYGQDRYAVMMVCDSCDASGGMAVMNVPFADLNTKDASRYVGEAFEKWNRRT